MNSTLSAALTVFAAEKLEEGEVVAAIYEVNQTNVPQPIDVIKSMWLSKARDGKFQVVGSNGNALFAKRKLKDAINSYYFDFLLK